MEDQIERPKKIQKLNHETQNDELSMPQLPQSLEQERSSVSYPMTRDDASKPIRDAAADTADDRNDQYEESEDSEQGNAVSDPPGPKSPMSKNQIKKLRKAQEWEAGRDSRKAKRKERIAATKERKRAARREEAQQQGEDAQQANGHPPKTKKVARSRLPVTFIIDCGFDDFMTEKERISLGSQLTRSYSDNHRAPFFAHLVVSSWGGLLKDRFDTVLDRHYENWRGVRFTAESFVEAGAAADRAMRGKGGGELAGAFSGLAGIMDSDGLSDVNSLTESAVARNGDAKAGEDKHEPYRPIATEGQAEPGTAQTTDPEKASDISKTSESPSENSELAKGEIIYLSSDSPHTLDRLEPYHTYIIGGLVDKNRHKGICYKKACDLGVKTAKLPISQYMEMQSRFVLATNHVLEIMVKWLECGDWGDAFLQVIPKRKGGKLKKGENFQTEHYLSQDDAGGDYLSDEEATPTASILSES